MTERGEILAPISVGEMIDKITILRIKRERIGDPVKRQNVVTELDRLSETCGEHGLLAVLDGDEARRLADVNRSLWEVEDDIRACERRQDFGARFVELARSVYILNDERARLKRAINIAAGSRFVEEKSFE